MSVRLFVELCAGTAALSLRLSRGWGRPPVSRMGGKVGYCGAILARLGLVPGEGADRYLWAEPDPGVGLLLSSYRDPDLAAGAAEVLRSWSTEDERALWERLRGEGPFSSDRVEPREAARWIWLQGRSMFSKGASSGFAPRESSNRIKKWGAHSCGDFATWVSAIPLLKATIAEDARTIDPPIDGSGSVVYIDPPYRGTTGYEHDLGRDEVVALAERWADSGSIVCISEAEPLEVLTSRGWFSVEITGDRVGQGRTFSRQQREWLTMNREPMGQLDLFGLVS